MFKSFKFNSETDTEVIAQLIGLNLDKGYDTKDAVSHALSRFVLYANFLAFIYFNKFCFRRCDGSWGLAVVNKDKPSEIVVACNGSPMVFRSYQIYCTSLSACIIFKHLRQVIGLGQGKTFIASETSAFSRYTKNYIAMKDGEIGVVRSTDTTLDISRVQVAPEHDVLLTPDPYPHFTLKECLEQPEAIARALSYGARLNEKRVILGGLDKNRELMETIQNLLLTGCGTSKHAAEFGAKIMRDLDCFDMVSVLDSAEVINNSKCCAVL